MPPGAALLEWAWAAAFEPISGESCCGDVQLAMPFPGGALFSVIDGLGHGPEAEAAAVAARDTLCEAPADPVPELLKRCHRRLGRLRGAVMSVASLDLGASTLTWAGVGNVEACVVRPRPSRGAPLAHQRLLLWGGVVGQSLPAVRPFTLTVHPGDVLVMLTDGVNPSLIEGLSAAPAPAPGASESRVSQRIRTEGSAADRREQASSLLSRFSTGSDDALVLLAWFSGASA